MSKRSTVVRQPAWRCGLFACALALMLSSCIWPMEPTPTWRLTFQGQAVHAATGAGVPDARVEIWFESPEAIAGTPPNDVGQTNADGDYHLETRDREMVPPVFATVRVTPPVGSGLATSQSGGLVRDVFASVVRSDGHRVRYDTVITLAAVQPAESL